MDRFCKIVLTGLIDAPSNLPSAELLMVGATGCVWIIIGGPAWYVILL